MSDGRVPDIWWRWLIVASLFLMVFGFLMVFFNSTILEPFGRESYNSFFDNAPFDSLSIGELSYQNWIVGVLGAVAIGWACLMLFVVYYPFRKGERWAWNAFAVSLIIWYTLDTGVSMYHGVVLNAVSNTFFLLLFGTPLVLSRKYF